jgi:2-hydroxy-3-keto-5-methylthiopentenyl-1-phosphate phosphatase
MPLMPDPLARLLVLLDYDGTVTAHECNDLVLQNLTGDAWREPEAALHQGLIGHAECFSRQVALVNAPREQYIGQLVRAAELAPGFGEFLRTLHASGARTAVVSAGFREAIEAVWRHNSLPEVRLFASELAGERPPYRLVLDPALGDCPVCGPSACKGALARALRQPGDVLAVFGDAHSDLCMAREADVIFARGTLADLCRRENLPYRPLSDYRDALAELRLELALRLPPEALT